MSAVYLSRLWIPSLGHSTIKLSSIRRTYFNKQYTHIHIFFLKEISRDKTSNSSRLVANQSENLFSLIVEENRVYVYADNAVVYIPATPLLSFVQYSTLIARCAAAFEIYTLLRPPHPPLSALTLFTSLVMR